MQALRVLLFMLVFLPAVAKPQSTKHALIIAIGDYPDPQKNRWPKISSVNDIPLISNALESQGFGKKNIKILRDEQATKEGILSALDRLVEETNAGDIAVVHISSHGLQISDDNGDEIDGRDEAIVPYGAVYSTDPASYAANVQRYIRDDLFGDKLTLLRNKLGRSGDVLVLIDACHSGSATRAPVGTAKIRGTNPAMLDRRASTAPNTSQNKHQEVFSEASSNALNADASSYVIISGAEASEQNFECLDDEQNAVGSLSYAFSKSVTGKDGKNARLTYRGLFEEIRQVMNEKVPVQKPTIEGNGENRQVFGGKFIPPKLYFSVENWLSDSLCVIDGGSVSGLLPETRVGFYPASVNNPVGTTPAGTGTIVSTKNFKSFVASDFARPGATGAYRVFITETSYSRPKVKVDVTNAKEFNAAVRNRIKTLPFAELNTVCDLYIDTFETSKQWAIKYANSGYIFEKEITLGSAEGLNKLAEALSRFSKYTFLKSLNFLEEGLTAHVEFTSSNNQPLQNNLGKLEVADGDQVFLKIINTGSKDFYVNIVDMQPDGYINSVLPNRKLRNKNNTPSPLLPEDCFIKSGDSLFRTDMPLNIGPPFGTENFKVFLSTTRIDLERLLVSEKDQNRSAEPVVHPLERLFETAIQPEATRGQSTPVKRGNNGTVFDFTFEIKPYL